MGYWIFFGIILVWWFVSWAVKKHRQGIRDRAAHIVLDGYDFAAVRQEILSIVPNNLPLDLNEKVSGRKVTDAVNLRRQYEKMICPRDHGAMVQRTGRYGTFWGCSNYPRCTYTKNKL